MESVEYRPLVAFEEDPSPSYVHGFEAGMIWQRMQDGEAEIINTVHTENAGTLRNMANAAGYEIEMEPTGVDGWSTLTLRLRPKRGALSVVK